MVAGLERGVTRLSQIAVGVSLFILIATLATNMLIFFARGGFRVLESGTVRPKDTMNIMARNFVVLSLGFRC